jgi:hypothetical protein
MKCALRWSVVLMLATTLVAQTATKKSVHKAVAVAPAVTAEDVKALRDALAAQQQQIQQLQQQLQQTNSTLQQSQQQLQQTQSIAADAQQKAVSVAAADSDQKDTVVKLSADMADVKTTLTNTAVNTQEDQKRFSALEGAMGHLKMSGDLRLRFEPFFGGGPANGAASQERFRERYRLRFNINTKIDNDFLVGFSLASGDTGDPVSTNSTETGFFTRKPIAIDKAFGTYTPHSFKPFTVTVGKFGYTWLRTELVWDNDLNPEGASEQLSWNWKGKVINHFAIIGIESPFFEVSGGPDSYMTGGQVQTGFDFGRKIKLTADVAYYDFANTDTIAQNQGQTPGNGFPTQGIAGTGGSNFGFSASSLSNTFGVISGKRVFASKYGIVDAIARLDIDTGWKGWPIYILGDYAQNTRACENVGAFIAASVAAPACDPHARHAGWGEFQFGQTKNKGDMRLGYTFMRIERDAVLSAFNFSDLRQPTNVLEHRLEGYYQLHPHVQVGVTGLIGRQIVNASAPTEERWLKRWQFDTIYSF